MKMEFIKKYFPYFLFAYHLVFAWLAYDYVNQNNGDAVKYWFVGRNMEKLSWFQFLNPGTDAIYFLTFPFVKYLALPGWAGCLIFSAWSGIGFLKLWKLLKEISGERRFLLALSMILLLLPNAHFWTSLIGKEAFLFLPVVCIAEKIYRKEFWAWSLWVSFFILAWIRPHVAFVFLFAYVISIIWKGEFSVRIKAFLGILGIVLASGLYFLLSRITQAQTGLFEKIQRLYIAHNLKLKGTSGYVPLEDYVYPYKLFTFYFRPFLFEREGIYYGVLGLENLIYLVVFAGVLYAIILAGKKIKAGAFTLFAVLLLFLYGTMFAYGYANFGMIIRTKTLVFPVILILVVSIFNQTGSEMKAKFLGL